MKTETKIDRQPDNAANLAQSKGERRKEQILDHALACLTARGYAETSMRDIAASAGLNLGRLHYYFANRAELLLAALLRYKASFIDAISAVVERDSSAEEAREDFVRALVAAATRDAMIHRLWYDIKARSLFDAGLQPVVDQLEDDMKALVGRLLVRLGRSGDVDTRDFTYALLDGVFFWGVSHSARGDGEITMLLRSRLLLALDVDTNISPR